MTNLIMLRLCFALQPKEAIWPQIRSWLMPYGASKSYYQKEVVRNLAMEVVRKIIDVEKEGEEAIRKAQAIAAEIQKKSKDEAEVVIRGAKEKAEEYYKNTISEYEMEGREASKPMQEENEKARAKLTSISAELMDSAVNMVIERIVDSHGNR